jgi:hypothetical protein
MEDGIVDRAVLAASTQAIVLVWISQRLPSRDVQWALGMV